MNWVHLRMVLVLFRTSQAYPKVPMSESVKAVRYQSIAIANIALQQNCCKELLVWGPDHMRMVWSPDYRAISGFVTQKWVKKPKVVSTPCHELSLSIRHRISVFLNTKKPHDIVVVMQKYLLILKMEFASLYMLAIICQLTALRLRTR